MAKKTALLGMLVALAFVLSYIETLIPVNLGIPGAKLGLANLVVMVALYTLGTKEAFALSMVRILLTGLTFSSMAAMLYSFAGGLLSFAVMYLAKRSKLFSAAGVSVLGGISHNAGQIFVAMWVLDTATLIYYLPVLAITGIASGTVIGLLAVGSGRGGSHPGAELRIRIRPAGARDRRKSRSPGLVAATGLGYMHGHAPGAGALPWGFAGQDNARGVSSGRKV